MAHRTLPAPLTLTLTLTLALAALPACADPDPMGDTSATQTTSDGSTSDASSSSGETETTGVQGCEGVAVPAIDESGCEPLATDYQPRTNNSADDMWAACITDDAAYHLVGATTGTIARIEAYEKIADLLWRSGPPTPADFTAARDHYVLAEGLESRLVRREDLHLPPIPMADWDPGVDPDKQCTVEANVQKYPDRCVGPAKIAPLVAGAFDQGQLGKGDPDVLAAEIQAGLLWFLYLSVYKEANTCATVAGKDCDSAWAYYNGGTDLNGGLGMATPIRTQSFDSHARIWDGLLAVRCWRDLYAGGGAYPTLDTLDAAAALLFARGWEQLDEALHRGHALIVRERLEGMIDRACAGEGTAADWAFLRVAGPVLDREAAERDPALAAELAALWATSSPSVEALLIGVDLLDALFPCG